MYCGGLPENPRPPLGYKLVFNLEGVLGNYFGKAYVLRDGEIGEDEPLSRRQTLEVDGVGRLEAAVTGGATATAAWTWKGKLRSYDYKTLRYPGHWDRIETLRDLGLLDEKPVAVGRGKVSPRDVFVACAEERLRFPDDRDLLVQRVIVAGEKGGRPARAVYNLLDRFDPATGFTAMQRTTGFSAAAVLAMAARGSIKEAGVLPLEAVVPPFEFIEELRRRGVAVKEDVTAQGNGRA
jgi:lysine 6-dehydrogenase